MCSNGWLEFNEFFQFNVSSRLSISQNLQRTKNGNSVVCSCWSCDRCDELLLHYHNITIWRSMLCNDCLSRGLSVNFIILFILGILVCTQNYRKWLWTHRCLVCIKFIEYFITLWVLHSFSGFFFGRRQKNLHARVNCGKKFFGPKFFARRIFENEIDRKTNGKKNTHHRVHAQWNGIGIPSCICACIPSKLFYKIHDHELQIAECSANFVHLLRTFFLSGRHSASSENFILFNDCRSSVPTQKKWNHFSPAFIKNGFHLTVSVHSNLRLGFNLHSSFWTLKMNWWWLFSRLKFSVNIAVMRNYLKLN